MRLNRNILLLFFICLPLSCHAKDKNLEIRKINPPNLRYLYHASDLLAPLAMDNVPDMQKIIDKIGIDAYIFYAQLAKGENNDFKQGALIVTTFFSARED